MKTAIAIMSDPKNGSEESLGRVFNALAAAYDFKNAGQEVSIQGTSKNDDVRGDISLSSF